MISTNEKVVVIGGGIAGLTAAAYLARAGVDVELFEQHYRLGGCCTSFKRRKFIFDAAVHGVGGCQPGGFLRQAFEDIGIWDNLEMLRSDPMDVVLSPYYYVPIWTDTDRFLEELRHAFPHEIDRLAKFIHFLNNFSLADLAQWGGASFRNILDHYLQDNLAKTLFILPLGNLGMSARTMDAVAACSLWKENQLNGGYAPRGSFQSIADALGRRVQELGGKVHLRQEVAKLTLDASLEGNKAITGVQTRAMLKGVGQDRNIDARYVICAGAVQHLYYDLIGKEHLPQELIHTLETAEYSLAGGSLFLGLKTDIHKVLRHGGNHWYFNSNDIEEVEAWVETPWIEQHMFDHTGPFYFAQPTHYDRTLAPPGKSVLVALAPSLYKPRAYWQENKSRLEEAIISRIEQVIPDIRDHIEIAHGATSSTMEWYTRNTRGAWYGWSLDKAHSNLRRMDRHGIFNGLYLAGHWTRPGGGMINAIKSGQLTARAVLRDLKRKAKTS